MLGPFFAHKSVITTLSDDKPVFYIKNGCLNIISPIGYGHEGDFQIIS